MVRVWSEEVGNARSVIEPILRELKPNLQVNIEGGMGFSNETVEIVIGMGRRRARCVVTFEAWESARNDPAQMRTAFRRIIHELEGPSSLPQYMLTTRGLTKELAKKRPELVRTMAAGQEADRLAQGFLTKSRR